MSDGAIGIVLLLAITLLISVVIHRRSTRFWRACLAATAASLVVFEVFAYIRVGYFDPFNVIAVPMSFLISFPVSVIVGNTIRSLRRKAERTRNI